MGLVKLNQNIDNPDAAFTHTLNELRYYINCGIVVLICSAAFLVTPNPKLVLAAFLSTIPLHLLILYFFPDMNYFVRAMWVILIAFFVVGLALFQSKWRTWRELIVYDSPRILQVGIGLLTSLIALHIIFH